MEKWGESYMLPEVCMYQDERKKKTKTIFGSPGWVWKYMTNETIHEYSKGQLVLLSQVISSRMNVSIFVLAHMAYK